MSVQNKKTPKRQSVGAGTPKQSACEWKPCRTCDAVFPARDFAKHVSSCNQDGGVQNSTCFIKGGKLFAVAEDVQDHSCIHHLPSNEVSNLVLVNPAALQRCQISIGSSVLLETSERIYAAVLTAWPCHHLSPTSIALPGNRTIPLNVLAGHSVTVAEFTPTGESASEVFLEILSEAQESLLEPLTLRFLDQFNFRYLNVGMKLFLRYLGNNVRVVVRDIKGPPKNLEDSLASLSVGDSADYKMVCSDTQVKFLNFQRESQNENMLKLDDIGGLESAKTELKKLVSRVLHKDGGYLVRGVLLHGPSGCGKTILAKAVAAEHNLTLINVVGSELYSKFYGETETKLKERFEEAVRRAPSLLLFDDVDTVCGRRDDSSATSDQERRVLSTFIRSLDELGNSNTKCFLIATTNRLDSLDSAIRGPRRLDREIEITVPSSLERSDILRKKVAKMKTSLTDEDVGKIGTVTHGFVGSDIDALLAEAHMSASKRGGEIDMIHMNSALKKVKPSALREVQVEVPNVKWSDVGGQDKLKEKLKQAVEWPIKHAETLKRLGISSPKGLLMYGPPGCSKTLIAKALATESGLNFIAVKSSDLFSKYVGDSEKAVRDVFRRARQVAPSIIFFDEIDALATNRSGGSSQGISVNDRVLAQLLTEMDGVTALNDVQIIAATNRPDMIDKALMRPGRLDRVVYVPLPERETRLAIFTLMLRKMAVSQDVSVEKLVEKTDMYSGAEVCAVCQEAGLLCLEEDINATIIDERHFDQALQIVRPRTTLDSINFYEKFSCERGFSKI